LVYASVSMLRYMGIRAQAARRLAQGLAEPSQQQQQHMHTL
jgi:hypothetical protein